MPTKALLHAAEVADATRDAGRSAYVRAAGLDMPAVNAYKQGVVDRLHQGPLRARARERRLGGDG